MTPRNPPGAIHGLYVWSAKRWRAEGVTQKQLQTLVRSGDLIRTRHGVYATRKAMAFAATDARHAHAVAAMSAIRVASGGIVSHHSAAILHELDMLHPPDMSKVTMTFPPGRTGAAEDIVRYRARLTRDQTTEVFGVYVTSIPRTVIDLARISTFMQGVIVADCALRKATTADELKAVLGTCAGWPGIDLARRTVEFADGRSESVLESCARVLFHEHGLEPPEPQVWIRGYRVDFCWEKHKVIVETDGLGKYADDPRRKISEQTRRDNMLRRLGYTVIHVTWEELFTQKDKIIADIRRALRQ